MEIVTLNADEVWRMADCMERLAAHHNAIPAPFSGLYPVVPIALQLEKFAHAVAAGIARVTALVDGDDTPGICKTSWEASRACVDLLYVRDELRGQGWGRRLFEEQLAFLRGRDVALIDILVVLGNDAKGFYEQYGFSVRTQILGLKNHNA